MLHVSSHVCKVFEIKTRDFFKPRDTRVFFLLKTLTKFLHLCSHSADVIFVFQKAKLLISSMKYESDWEYTEHSNSAAKAVKKGQCIYSRQNFGTYDGIVSWFLLGWRLVGWQFS